RRDFLCLGAAAAAGLARGDAPSNVPHDLHQQILDEAARQEAQRRARFAAVTTPAGLEGLQKELRERFLSSLDGLPTTNGLPPVQKTGQIDGGAYRIEKLVFQSLPGYFVPALL